MSTPKVLVLAGKDRFLQELIRNVSPDFFRSVARPDITAVICPYLSDYAHSDHRVGLDNRAIVQAFMCRLLQGRLPGVFFTYLDLSPQYHDWLVEYFALNPTQHFLATGFDRGAAKNRQFVMDRIEFLLSVEAELGRPLRLVASGLLTSLGLIRRVSEAFPGRLHLLGQSLYLRSLKGSRLVHVGPTSLQWRERDRMYSRGDDLVRLNQVTLEEALQGVAPRMFDRASSPRSLDGQSTIRTRRGARAEPCSSLREAPRRRGDRSDHECRAVDGASTR